MKNLKKLYLHFSLSMYFITGIFFGGNAFADTTTSVTITPTENILTAMLNGLNQAPAYLSALTEMAQSWMQEKPYDVDQYQMIPLNQADFINLETNISTDLTAQTSLSNSITQNFLLNGSMTNPVTMPKGAADTSFTTRGTPFYGYSSGMTIPVTQPNSEWYGSAATVFQKYYVSYYQTISSIQSYDAFVISKLNEPNTTGTETALITRARSSSWFSAIATESLGLVLRDILMYSSQSFVELNRIAELQKQQLALQGMTNTLLLINLNNSVSPMLLQKARGR